MRKVGEKNPKKPQRLTLQVFNYTQCKMGVHCTWEGESPLQEGLGLCPPQREIKLEGVKEHEEEDDCAGRVCCDHIVFVNWLGM